jgi:hypothetical protein
MDEDWSELTQLFASDPPGLGLSDDQSVDSLIAVWENLESSGGKVRS